MKRLNTILLAVVLAAVIAAPAIAQSPPATVVGGTLFQNGGAAKFALQVAGNINVIQKKEVLPTGDSIVVGQSFVRLGGIYADDAQVTDSLQQELQAITGYALAERTMGPWSIATGVGLQVDIANGEDQVHAPALLEVGYRPWDAVRFTAGVQYIPIVKRGDLQFVYFGVGIAP